MLAFMAVVRARFYMGANLMVVEPSARRDVCGSRIGCSNGVPHRAAPTPFSAACVSERGRHLRVRCWIVWRNGEVARAVLLLADRAACPDRVH